VLGPLDHEKTQTRQQALKTLHAGRLKLMALAANLSIKIDDYQDKLI
jgi:hypothetical protein